MTLTAPALALVPRAFHLWWSACAYAFARDDDTAGGGERVGDEATGAAAVDGAPGPELGDFWRGDGLAIEAVYRAHARRLLGTARAIVGAAEAESVVHEVFVELIRNEELRRRFTGGSVGAWLGAIARRKSLEHLRRRGRAAGAGGGATGVGNDAGSFSGNASAGSGDSSERLAPWPEPRLEARDLLMRFLKDSVPAAQVDFFRRRFLDGQTQVEVAAALGVPRSTLEGWEHRLSDKLRRFIWESSQ